MPAPANTYPSDLSTVYGSVEAWQRLYASRLYVERTLPNVRAQCIASTQRWLKANRQVMAAFGEVQLTSTKEQIATLDSLVNHNVAESQELRRLARLLDNLDIEQKGTDEDFKMSEDYVGDRLKALPPPPAVTRAIGEKSLFSSKLWLASRTQIEVFRYVVGEQRPNTTLGPEPKEDWAQHARCVVTQHTHEQQLIEIMASDMPVMTAAQYGHVPVLDRVGAPPSSLHAQHSMEWLMAATDYCQAINPPEAGLVIDR